MCYGIMQADVYFDARDPLLGERNVVLFDETDIESITSFDTLQEAIDILLDCIYFMIYDEVRDE